MPSRTSPKTLLLPTSLASLMALALAAGCGSKTPDVDTAEVVPSKAPKAEPPTPGVEMPAPTVTPGPRVDTPKG